MQDKFATKNIDLVNSEEEIISTFDSIAQSLSLNLSKEESFSFIAKIVDLFHRCENVKISASFNNNIKDKGYESKGSAYKKIVTVPKNIDKYFEYQKGNFIPICKFSGLDTRKSTLNDYTVYADFDRKIVKADVVTKKFIYDNRNKLIDSYCSGVAIFVIPNPQGLIRGKIKDLVSNNSNIVYLKNKPIEIGDRLETLENLSDDYTNLSGYLQIIEKSILHICRIDLDSRHGNNFEDVPGYNKDKKKVLDEYFRKFADPPHFHFIYKGYVLNHNQNDSSALAINVDFLTRYLIDLRYADKSNPIFKEDFGMPFIDILNSSKNFSGEEIRRLTSRFKYDFQQFSEEEKSDFSQCVSAGIMNISKRMSKIKCSKDEISDFVAKSNRIMEIIFEDKDFSGKESFDPILLLALQTNIISNYYKFSRVNTKYKSQLDSVLSDFYGIVGHCLSQSDKSLNKNQSEILQRENQ